MEGSTLAFAYALDPVFTARAAPAPDADASSALLSLGRKLSKLPPDSVMSQAPEVIRLNQQLGAPFSLGEVGTRVKSSCSRPRLEQRGGYDRLASELYPVPASPQAVLEPWAGCRDGLPSRMASKDAYTQSLACRQ